MTARDREELCRILHDANTGRITPDDSDPTRYGAMADAVLARLGGKLPTPPRPPLRVPDNLPPGHPLPWDELVPYEREQGGYWFYPKGCDAYGNGKVFVPVARSDLRG